MSNPPFAEWMESVFRRPVREPSWWWDEDARLPLDPEGAPIRGLELLTELWETPSAFGSYTQEQVAQGLWFLFDSSCSRYTALLRNPSLPWPSRRRCLEGLLTLYGELFALRCTRGADDPDEDPLYTTCYMLWDLSEALEPNPDDATMDGACLEILAQILRIPHDACQKSALHALGHWAKVYPARIEQMIDGFLETGESLHPNLRTYALEARAARVP